MNYVEAKQQRDRLETASKEASRVLQAFPKTENGLVSDAVRESQEYQTAKAQYDQAFKALRNFNNQFVKVFAREIRRERRSR